MIAAVRIARPHRADGLTGIQSHGLDLAAHFPRRRGKMVAGNCCSVRAAGDLSALVRAVWRQRPSGILPAVEGAVPQRP